MRVTTDSRHYENMAAKIREKTGTDATYKPSEMPSGVDAVYKAGQSSMVDESKLIPKTVSGNNISVDDVSEIPHSVGCKVESVNLLNPNALGGGELVEFNGVPCYKYRDRGGGVTYPDSLFIEGWFKENTQYTFTAKQYRDEGNSRQVWVITTLYTDGTEVYSPYVPTNTVYTYTTAAGKTVKKIFAAYYSGSFIYLDLSVSCLHEGTEALPYTPYVSPESVKVTRTGRNIVDILNGKTQYATATVRDKTANTIVLSCTETYRGVCYILPKNLVGKHLTISGEWDAANGARGGLRINWIKTNNAADMTSTQIWTGTSGRAVSGLVDPPPADAAFLGLMVYGNSDGSIDGEGLVSYRNIQVEIGDKATPYEPYNGQTLTPNADGTIEGMTSVSPYMNIFSDTEGVNIEATYNKSYGMQTEWDRFWDNFQDYGSRTDYVAAFRTWGHKHISPKYPISSYSLYEFLARSKCETFDWSMVEEKPISSAYYICGLQEKIKSCDIAIEPDTPTPSATFIQGAFYCAYEIETIKKIISVEAMKFVNTFGFCNKLKHITFEGVIGNSINFQWSPLTKVSITNIINTLSSTVTGQTLTLKLSAVNTAFETSSGAGDGSTSAEFAALVATKTNWTITMV